MCKFSSKSGGVPFQPLGDLTWNDPIVYDFKHYIMLYSITNVQIIIRFNFISQI